MGRIYFVVPGDPKGKGRPRFTKNGRCYTPETTKLYEREVVANFLFIQRNSGYQTIPQGVPVTVDIEAVFAMPQSWSKKKRADMVGTACLKKPDGDNVLKIIADALNGIAWYDDAQVSEASIRKTWGQDGYAEVFIRWDSATFNERLKNDD